MQIRESGLVFEFLEGTTIKFDDSNFYRNYFNKLPGSKGVDILSDSTERFLFMEVKNCSGYESDNRWRIAPNNSKVSTVPTTVDTADRDSVDVEMAQKVAMTIAAIMGAHTKGIGSAVELHQFLQGVISAQIRADRKKLFVLLFLEGSFQSRTRTKKMIMKSLQDSIKSKLEWLNCNVSVVDSNTYSNRIFYLLE